MCALPTPPSTASAQASNLGIMPPVTFFIVDSATRLGGSQAMDQAGGVVGIGQQAGRAGQIDDLFRPHRHRDCARGVIGIDIIGLAFGVGADGRDDRDQSVVEQVVEQCTAHPDPRPTKPRRSSICSHLEQPAVLAGDPDRHRLKRIDRRDDLTVGLADQHHADDVERRRRPSRAGRRCAVTAIPARAISTSICGPPPWTSTGRIPTEWSSSISFARLRIRAGSVIGSAADLDDDVLPVKRRM